MPKPDYIDKNIIEQLYYAENLKLHEVAQRLGICFNTLQKRMRFYEIPTKPPNVYRRGQCSKIVAMLPKAKELYYEKEFSFGAVCQELGTSFYTLKRLFDDNNLHIRNSSESTKLAYRKHPQMGFASFKGDKHPRFNGYRATKNTRGYIRLYDPSHHRAGINGYVSEHIIAWERAHGIPLPDGWIVHHLNGIKDDNRPENLAGMSSRSHSLVIAEKAKRIRTLENKIKELEKSLSEATKMNLP